MWKPPSSGILSGEFIATRSLPLASKRGSTGWGLGVLLWVMPNDRDVLFGSQSR